MLKSIALALGLVLGASAAQAKDDSVVTFGAGMYDLVSHRAHAFEGRAMYRSGYGVLGTDGVFRGLKLAGGVMFATNEALYGWAGLAAPFQFGRWEVEASAGLGAYHKAKGLELGRVFEFHLGLATSYAITESTRVGVAITHISNAGSHRVNPGLNSALATIGFAF